MTADEVRKRYLDFFAREPRNHARIPSASLIPQDDPTTLFTGSGMQPLLPYLLGQKHPKGARLVNSQKCFRAEDIEEVGDNRHTTFFEMLGNWSLGDPASPDGIGRAGYFKKEQLSWFCDFLTKEIGLDPKRLYATVFMGDEVNGIPRDKESAQLWENIFAQKGIEAATADMGTGEMGSRRGMKEGERIFYYDATKNWWSRAGMPQKMPAGEPGGPDSEVFYDFDPTGVMHTKEHGEHCHPNCNCGRFLEIGNSVFMEYVKQEDGKFKHLPQKNVDFGGGLERLAAAVKDDPDVFKVDLLYALIEEIEKLTGKKYEDNKVAFRVIVDHIRGAVFMIGDGIFPSNTEQGYFVRRLLRRAIFQLHKLQPDRATGILVHRIADLYKNQYPNISDRAHEIDKIVTEEGTKFTATLEKGLKEFGRLSKNGISGHDAFILFTSYGFPYELAEELAEEKGIQINHTAFEKEMKKHQEISRAGAERKFKGGLADHSEKVVRYHTATHLLLAGLRQELGDHVHQAGSNITGERLRFDFTHPEKVDREALNRVERYVNAAIAADAAVSVETMKKTDAEHDSAIEGSFWERYPDEVDIYIIKGTDGTVYSRELCGGPHVKRTGELSGTFTIQKEESVAAGVRRVKAVIA